MNEQDIPNIAQPPFDPELKACLEIVGGTFPPTITDELIPFMRQSYKSPPLEETLAGRAVSKVDYTIPGYLADPIVVSIFTPTNAPSQRPAILYAHSGGLMFGDRFSGIDQCLDWVEALGIDLVTVEYRLAPEYGDPYAREDMYQALVWLWNNAKRLGVDTTRIMVSGASAGGGLAAGLALAARDRGGPKIHSQLLIYPMLDDRGLSNSMRQFDGVGVWDRVSNETGWRNYLKESYRTDQVSPYASPSRHRDLTSLPPAYLDVGSAEVFRDETVEYATRLWLAGNDAELHVWPGGFHAFDIFAPHTTLAQGMISTRTAWVAKMLAD